MPQKQRTLWTKDSLEAEKTPIKKELQEIAENKGDKESLKFALRRINELSEKEDELSRFHQYIYAISALVHHSRKGGLSPLQVRNLSTLVRAVLRVQGIRPSTSKRSFLYGYLSLTLSDIHWTEGALWQAAWEQQVGLHLSHRAPALGRGTQALALGVRALRLGHVTMALEKFYEAESQELERKHLARCKIEQTKCLRLLKRIDEARLLAKQSLSTLKLKEDERKEFQWEALCCKSVADQTIAPLIQAVKKGKPHHSFDYVHEAFLWSRCVSTKEWIDQFPTVNQLGRGAGRRNSRKSFLVKYLTVLQDCYDSSLDLAVRLEELGDVITQSNRLITINYELLFWASAARWLSRTNAYDLAALVLSKYESLSRTITNGSNSDSLGVVEDLLSRPWYPHNSPKKLSKSA